MITFVKTFTLGNSRLVVGVTLFASGLQKLYNFTRISAGIWYLLLKVEVTCDKEIQNEDTFFAKQKCKSKVNAVEDLHDKITNLFTIRY